MTIDQMTPFIDESKFKSLLREFQKEGWTKKGKVLHQNFIDYLETIEGIFYETNYTSLSSFDLETTVWSITKYNVPKSRRGHLKRYRGYNVLIIVLSKFSGYKRVIGCFPLTMINE